MNDTQSKTFSIQREMLNIETAHGSQMTETIKNALKHLSKCLALRGFQLRDDSRLAFLWATQRLPQSWTDVEVVHEICCQQWLCENTEYTKLSQPFLRALAEKMRTKYNMQSWNTTWRIVRDYGPDILKAHCVLHAGGFPSFPCMNGYTPPILEQASDGHSST